MPLSSAVSRRERNATLVVLVATIVAFAGCSMAGAAPAAISPAPASLGAEAVRFQSASGSLIHAWLARGQRGSGAVLLLHGVGANRASMLPRAQFLHAMGFTVLLPDFQAHGESPGKHVTFGARESLDAAAALAFLNDVAPGERVGVIGVSMGGAASLLGPGPLPVNALVLESVYPTIREAVRDRLASWSGPLAFAGRRLTPLVLRIVGNIDGVSEAELQPIQRIGNIRAPLLFLAGSADPYTPLAEAEALFARAPNPKIFWKIDGARHEDLHRFTRIEYERRVGRFLIQNLRAGPSAKRSE